MKLRIEQPALDSGIGIDPAVAQKRPVCPMFVHPRPIDLRGDNFFPIDTALGDDFAVRTANKALAPKFNPVATGRSFVPNPVRGRNETAVRNRMTPLNGLPSRMLCLSELLLLARMPADCSRIKNNLGAAKRSQPRRLRVPLVSANAHANVAALSFPGGKSEVPGGEIKFLVIEWIVRNMHFAVLA